MASLNTSKNAKRNIYLIVAAVVMILVLRFFPEKGGGDQVSFSAIDKKVDRMIFTRSSGDFTIEVKGENWVIGSKGYPVDHSKAEKASSFISQDLKAEIVSKSDVYQPYGLEDEESLEITFYSGSELLKTLKVGKSANRFETFYGLVDDDPTVYQINFDRYNLDYEEKGILNLKVHDFSSPKIVKVELNDKGGKAWTLSRVERKTENNTNQTPPEKIWEDNHGKVISKEKVNDIINIMSTLQADEINNLNATADPPIRKIKLTSEDGIIYHLDIIVKVDDDYWVKNPDKNYYYRITSSTADKLLSDLP